MRKKAENKGKWMVKEDTVFGLSTYKDRITHLLRWVKTVREKVLKERNSGQRKSEINIRYQMEKIFYMSDSVVQRKGMD